MQTKRHYLLSILTLVAASHGLLRADSTPPPSENSGIVDAALVANQKQHKDDPNMFIERGVVANKTDGTVEILAECMGLTAQDPAEFLLISPTSGHDYESYAVSFAIPSHVHAALSFIGIPPGAPVAQDKLRFWPKGERVAATIQLHTNSTATAIPIASAIRDTRTSTNMQDTGFIFTGSYRRPDKVNPERSVYAADSDEPGSIISFYNEPLTVLDMPVQLEQGETYGRYLPDATQVFPKGSLLRVTLSRKATTSHAWVRNLTLTVAPDNTTNPPRVALSLTDDATGATLIPANSTDLTALADAAGKAAANQDLYLSVEFSPALPLRELHGCCSFIEALEKKAIVRVEPPTAPALYYKAFLPREGFRDRKNRPAQPRELRLKKNPDGVLQATLVEITQEWKKDQVMPELHATDHLCPTPDAVGERMQAIGNDIPVLLVFVAPEVTYADILRFLEPLRLSHPTVHVYMDK